MELALGALIFCVLPAPARAQTVWELTPYRIEVVLALGWAPELTPDLAADLSRDLRTRTDSLVGAAWDLRVTDAPAGLRSAMIRDLDAVTVDLVEKHLVRRPEVSAGEGSTPGEKVPPEEGKASSAASAAEGPSPGDEPSDLDQLDKVILLVVRPQPVGYEVVARELDTRTRQWSTTVRVPAWQAAKLRDAAFAATWRAFSPLAEIVAVEKNVVTLRLRAAGFPMRDKTMVAVHPGDVFLPVVRHNDRYGKLKAAGPVPWTLLSVSEVTGGGLTCTLHSGLRTPLSGRRRGRYEQLAVAVSPPGKSTRLVLQSRTKPNEPLSGYDVYSHPPDSKTTVLVGRTDREGSVIVPPAKEPLRVLLVKDGREFLARLPLVPGREAEVSAEIANDDQRLEAEGFIAGLQEELVDLVTRREVLLAQAQSRIDERKYDEADELIRRLRQLETREDFALHVAQEQKKVFSADKLVEAKIDQMFSKVRKLVDSYLDPAVIEAVDADLRDARAGRPRRARPGEPRRVAGTSGATAPAAAPPPELVAKSLLGGKLTMLVPKGFSPMREEVLKFKYPVEQRPTMVLTDESGQVNVTLNHTATQASLAQLPEVHKTLEATFKQVYPSATWLRSEVTQIGGRPFIVMELRTPAEDTEIYNLMAATSLDGRLLMVTFNATREMEPAWVPLGHQIIESIQISE